MNRPAGQVVERHERRGFGPRDDDLADGPASFVARDEGTFEPRYLVLGARGEGLMEVREGLAEGERVVVRGNFLIDAESNLRAALSAFGAAAPEGAQ